MIDFISYLNFKVTNNYKKELNIKVQGAGVGGCDVILQPGAVDTSDCWCLWGTLHYSFCAYSGGRASEVPAIADNSTVADGRCPVVTGETLLCSDLASLGNCYEKSYACVIDATGLCACQESS